MNTNLINSLQDANIMPYPQIMTRNHEGVAAYQLTSKQALAQLVSTGTINNTYYVNAQNQLNDILALAQQVDSEFLAKLATYARLHSRMKDTPVLLLAVLSTRADGQALFKQVFAKIINNGKQLRNFVQVMRSGTVGRKSLGSMPKKMVNNWLNSANDYQYVSATIGNTPSLQDVLRMSHPKPIDNEKEALFQWTLGKDFNHAHLPKRVQQLLAFQKDNTQPLPDVPLQLLMALPLTTTHWAQVAEQGNFTMVRMNLNTFARHGVFELNGMSEKVVATLTDAEAIVSSGVFPYQLYTTWASVTKEVPASVKQALTVAMDLALTNVPVFKGNVVVAVDTSGSMSSPVTGYRRGATSVVRCVDAAALFAAAIKRVNPATEIIAFDTEIRKLPKAKRVDMVDCHEEVFAHATLMNLISSRRKKRKLHEQLRAQLKEALAEAKTKTASDNTIDVMQLASALASLGGGGTNVSLPLSHLNSKNALIDVMIYFSDNQSWVDSRYGCTTQMMIEWDKLKKRCPKAKLICVDVQPYQNTQAHERKDVLNIGGFGDDVFRLIDLFVKGQLSAGHWIDQVERTSIATQH